MNHLLFGRMYHLFSLNKEDYLRRYHRRSNVESMFSAVKRAAWADRLERTRGQATITGVAPAQVKSWASVSAVLREIVAIDWKTAADL
jgi:hypothetical protein